jgi:hypothetical protein
MFIRQFIPRQICVQERYQDSTVATIRAIIVYFHAPHRTTNDEVLYLRPDFKKVFGILVESLSAKRTSYSGDGLRASLSSRVHHPENPELLGAIGTLGDKLIGHEALSSRTSVDARSRTAAAPETVACLMPRIFRLA